jgi:hypothetical protein
MEKSSKRGKIPQSDWPLIMARYEAGETLASIARTYNCSPPAISYVVSRSRARSPGHEQETADKPTSPPEPQLVKAAEPSDGADEARPTGPAAANGHTPAEARSSETAARRAVPDRDPAAAAELDNRHRGSASNGVFGQNETAGRTVNPPSGGSAQAASGERGAGLAPRSNGHDQRRTLHLALGGGSVNGTAQSAQPAANGRTNDPQRMQPARPHGMPPHYDRDDGAPELPGIRPSFGEPARRDSNTPRKEGAGSFIDKELRARVDADIAAFLAAFDAALVQDTQESRSALREATDRLLRAGARTRIELERLEARMPLPARDPAAGGEPAWRHR